MTSTSVVRVAAPSSTPGASSSPAPGAASSEAASAGPTKNSAATDLEDVFAGLVVERPNPHPPQDHRPIMLFDGGCSVCQKIAAWVRRKDDPANGGKQAIDEREIGYDPKALETLGVKLDIMELYDAPHVLMPGGELKRGGEAIAEVFKRLPATAWLGKLSDVQVGGRRPVLALIDFAYRALDKLRPALGCESCGDKNTPWWGKPVEWSIKGYEAIFGKSEEPTPPA